MYNPYLYGMQQPMFQSPVYANQNGSINQQQEFSQMSNPNYRVIRVHGEEGAKTFGLGPNSSVLLLDETQPMVWLKMTDGAGYPTLTGYDIKPHDEATPQTVANENEEIASLEERIKRIEDDIYGNKSNTCTANKRYDKSNHTGK